MAERQGASILKMEPRIPSSARLVENPQAEEATMLSKPLRSRTLAVLLLVLPLLALGGGAEAKKGPPPVPWTGPVPKADCGPDDRVETGLQGQTTVAERESGLSEQGFNCNLELVGQFQGEGASWQHAWFDDCAYYDTANNPEQQHRGVVVVDASDPSHPQATAYLDSRAMLDPWESLKVNKRRKLLGGNKGPGGPTDSQFAFYDIKDCAHPKLLADVDVPGHIGHAGDFAPDGRTYYGTWTRGRLTAMDISDPTQPKVLGITQDVINDLSVPFRPHDLSISEDGTRAYVAQIGVPNNPAFPGRNGLVILDVSDYQFRRPNPQVRTISTLLWEDGSAAQNTQPVKIKGRPYLIFTDEGGSGGVGPAARTAACAQGLPPYAFARIIDISDERNPQIVAKLMLEVHDPANCPVVLNDPPVAVDPSFGYDSHYCTVDDPENAKLLGCAYFRSGLRVFDIRDPIHPREIAYYKPPAQRMAFLPGSQLFSRTPDPEHGTPGGGDRTTDWASSNVRFLNKGGELQIWFTTQDNGFQIVRFTNRLEALTGLSFEQDHPGNKN
jgi:hypothetical protein